MKQALANHTLIKKDKFILQDALYEFPYHYLPHIDRYGHGSSMRYLQWSFEYLCYLLHVKEIVEQLQPTSLLDAGCGDGRLISFLNESEIDLHGVDLSERAISFAQAFNPNAQFEFADISEISRQFDVVTAIEVLEHISDEDMEPFVDGMASSLREGGHLIVTVPSKVLPVTPKHYRHYDLPLLRQHIEENAPELALVQIEYIYREPWWFKRWLRFCDNRFITIDLHYVRRRVWNHVWNELRFAEPDTGHHLVALFQKR